MIRNTLRTGGKILNNIAARNSTDRYAPNPGDIVSKHVIAPTQNLISKFRGLGHKQAHGQPAEASGMRGPKS